MRIRATWDGEKLPKSLKAALGRFLVLPAPVRRRYELIDLVRGIAAIAVVLWHYQHFLQTKVGEVLPVARLLTQPLSSILWPFYAFGYNAVQLFWVISGFVFSAVYAGRSRSTREFITARVARLYPLHLVTLVTIAVLQMISVRERGLSEIYGNNDLYHFSLQLFFASNWGLEHGLSFNAPVWSVSVEIVIYMIFWVSHQHLFKLGIIGPALMSALFAVAVSRQLDTKIFACGLFFFAGCLIFVIHRTVSTRSQVAVAAAMMGLGILLLKPQFGHAVALLVCSIVLTCAALDQTISPFIKRVHWVGDSTYSLYLWHIPV